MFHMFTLYEHFQIVDPMIRTNFSQCTRLYLRKVEAKILLVNNCEIMIVDSLLEELKHSICCIFEVVEELKGEIAPSI